jgi:hypothetical protein
MFAANRDEVIPREKAMIGAQSVMLTIFLSGVSLITMNTLRYGAQFTREYFTNSILPDIVEARESIFRRVPRETFL